MAQSKAKPRQGKTAARRKTKRASGGSQPKAPAEPSPPIDPVPHLPALEPETSEQAIVHIAQDAVVILRRELAYRAALSMLAPGSVTMADCISLLRLTTELGAAARRGESGDEQQADYSRLSPQERVQLAALQLKVDYR